jgi:adenosine deaminase CECR1
MMMTMIINNKLSFYISFIQIVDENDKKMSSKDVIELLIKLVDDFKLDHPQFLGMKAILTVRRDLTQTKTIEKMKRFTELHQSYPNFVIGFDLVGQVCDLKIFITFDFLYKAR